MQSYRREGMADPSPLLCRSLGQTNGFSGAEFKKFKSTAEANAYVNEVAVTPDAPSAAPPGTATMWFDGGSRGNPGLSGSGAVIFDDKNMELYRSCFGSPAHNVSVAAVSVNAPLLEKTPTFWRAHRLDIVAGYVYEIVPGL